MLLTLVNYKRGARKRNIAWQLTDAEARTIFQSECTYCGISPKKPCLSAIDRLDPAVGFTQTNCVASCKLCDVMKGKLDAAEFVAQCIRITRIVLKEWKENH